MEVKKRQSRQHTCSHLGVTWHVTLRKNNLERKKKTHHVVGTRQTQKRVWKGHCSQKTAECRVSLKEQAREKKRRRKGADYVTETQSRPCFWDGKCTLCDPKITWYENNRIRVGKHDKSAYGVIIMYFRCTLSSANNLVFAVTVQRSEVHFLYPAWSLTCEYHFLGSTTLGNGRRSEWEV